jgi:hypothetical protein
LGIWGEEENFSLIIVQFIFDGRSLEGLAREVNHHAIAKIGASESSGRSSRDTMIPSSHKHNTIGQAKSTEDPADYLLPEMLQPTALIGASQLPRLETRPR